MLHIDVLYDEVALQHMLRILVLSAFLRQHFLQFALFVSLIGVRQAPLFLLEHDAAPVDLIVFIIERVHRLALR